MTCMLCKADVPTGGDGMLLVLTYLGIVAAVGVLVFVPFRLAKGRRHRRIELVAAAAVLWGAAAAGLFIYSTGEQFKWADERSILIDSGYYDPQSIADAPPWPWNATIVLAAAYVAIVCGALLGGREQATR